MMISTNKQKLKLPKTLQPGDQNKTDIVEFMAISAITCRVAGFIRNRDT